MKKTLILGIVFVVLLVCAGVVSAGTPANLVQNGGFEKPKIFGLMYENIEKNLENWDITNHIDHIGSGWVASEGSQSIDLAGYYTEGAIRQYIDTDSSKSYDLSFEMAGNTDGGPAVKKVEVWWGGIKINTFTFDSTGKNGTNMGWEQKAVFNLTGSSGDTTELKFADVTEEGTAFGTALDDIVVKEHVIPFPTIALPVVLIIGLAGAVLLIQRTREH